MASYKIAQHYQAGKHRLQMKVYVSTVAIAQENGRSMSMKTVLKPSNNKMITIKSKQQANVPIRRVRYVRGYELSKFRKYLIKNGFRFVSYKPKYG